MRNYRKLIISCEIRTLGEKMRFALNNFQSNYYTEQDKSYKYTRLINTIVYVALKVIRHVFGFGIEFLENKDIGIFGHFIVIDFIKHYSCHTYFRPISTS